MLFSFAFRSFSCFAFIEAILCFTFKLSYQVNSCRASCRAELVLQLNIFVNFFLGPLSGILRQAFIIQSLGLLISTLWAQNESFIIAEKDLFTILKLRRAFCRLVKMNLKQIWEYPCWENVQPKSKATRHTLSSKRSYV